MDPCMNRCTFVERPAGQNISIGEALPSGADGFVLRRVCFGTLLTVRTPGSTHWTAAHVHAISPWQWFATLILMPLHVALPVTHVWKSWWEHLSHFCIQFWPYNEEHRVAPCCWAVLLPTHVRPVLSKVRPSAHSQRKEPWVFTQRPFVHTPGNTSHSLMSIGSGTITRTIITRWNTCTAISFSDIVCQENITAR